MLQYKYTFEFTWLKDTCEDNWDYDAVEGDGISQAGCLLDTIYNELTTQLKHSIFSEGMYKVTKELLVGAKTAILIMTASINPKDMSEIAEAVVSVYSEEYNCCESFNNWVGISDCKYSYELLKVKGKCPHQYAHKEFIAVGDKVYSIKECSICGGHKKFVVQ